MFFFCLNRESRYLLVLTENYAALPIVWKELLRSDDETRLGDEPVVIFGSSFPKDQEYTQVLTLCNTPKQGRQTSFVLHIVVHIKSDH